MWKSRQETISTFQLKFYHCSFCCVVDVSRPLFLHVYKPDHHLNSFFKMNNSQKITICLNQKRYIVFSSIFSHLKIGTKKMNKKVKFFFLSCFFAFHLCLNSFSQKLLVWFFFQSFLTLSFESGVSHRFLHKSASSTKNDKFAKWRQMIWRFIRAPQISTRFKAIWLLSFRIFEFCISFMQIISPQNKLSPIKIMQFEFCKNWL